jgi:chromosome segregation ATPase
MLSDEQKSHLSAMAKGRSRDSKGRLLPATSAHEAKIDELEAQVKEAEDMLVEMKESRNRFQADLIAANNRERALKRDKDGLNVALDRLTDGYEEGAEARRLAEGRYVALLRRRSIEWGILITSIVGGIVIAGLFALVNGGAK